jgi:hypothetical protein
MKIEIHKRPMILPYLAGNTDGKIEVDVWIYLRRGVGQVLLETVVDSEEDAEVLIEDLYDAFKCVELIKE